MKLDKVQVGVAGEYFVAGELSLRGYLAAITLRNSIGTDIIISNRDGEFSKSIQVKTNSSGKPKWRLTKKCESLSSDNHYYVFVILKEMGKRPDYYIVPSKVVAKFARDNHKRWLQGTKKDGTKRKDTDLRAFVDEYGKYQERWNLLEEK